MAGFRRCAFCQEEGAKVIMAWSVKDTVPELSLFIWAVCDKLGTRQLNSVECATVLAKLQAQFCVPKEELAGRYMPLLRLNGSIELLERYQSPAALEEPMRQWLAEERLSQEAALRLVEMAPEDARPICRHRCAAPGQKLPAGVGPASGRRGAQGGPKHQRAGRASGTAGGAAGGESQSTSQGRVGFGSAARAAFPAPGPRPGAVCGAGAPIVPSGQRPAVASPLLRGG